ncbi:DUF4019 domain-containing protein [Pseudoalteromonas ulvae]|nr:DUF4019 domain-containing protein [Pseudoalteromonas ulvae]
MKKALLGVLLVLPLMLKAEVDKLAVTDWLTAIDDGLYQQSWLTSSGYLQSQVPENIWVSSLSSARSQFGSIVSRELIDSKTLSDLPKVPQGDYTVMIYRTTFTKGTATETVTFMQTEDDWKAAGYYIK